MLITGFVSLLPAGSSDAETIQLERQSGTYSVPVRINGALTLNFVLDSGASDTQIPAEIFLTLFRTRTVSAKDFIGTQTYMLADGSEVPSDRFIMRDLRIGDHIVRDVVAPIGSVKGDPLLGQSFLSKLQSWTIDNEQHALILKDETARQPLVPRGVAPARPPTRLYSPGAMPPSSMGMSYQTPTPAAPPPSRPPLAPSTSPDEYLAYLVTLTRQHIDLLPPSLLGGRRGETVISVYVGENGDISNIHVALGSGYPDIDERIEQMVEAVRRFPPVPRSFFQRPEWFQGNNLSLQLRVGFPQALGR
jgi:TonB family protein